MNLDYIKICMKVMNLDYIKICIKLMNLDYIKICIKAMNLLSGKLILSFSLWRCLSELDLQEYENEVYLIEVF